MLSVPLQITSVYDLHSYVKLEVFWTFIPISMHLIVFFPIVLWIVGYNIKGPGHNSKVI